MLLILVKHMRVVCIDRQEEILEEVSLFKDQLSLLPC